MRQVQEWSGMTRKTLDRRLEKLISVGRIVGMKETTDDVIDIGTNKEIGYLNDDILQGDSLGTNLSLVETPINSDIIELNLPHETGSKVTNVSTMSQKPLKMVSGSNLSLTPNDIRIIRKLTLI